MTQRLRGLDLYKVPGVAETVDWARALAALGHTEATPAALRETMGAAIKHQEDLERSEEAIAFPADDDRQRSGPGRERDALCAPAP